jgi:hypothetical protein
MMMLWQQWRVDDGGGSDRQEALECYTTHPRQQSINGDSWGRMKQERGAILGDGAEKGRGGGDFLVEITTMELHEITSYPTVCPPQSSKRTGTIAHRLQVDGCAYQCQCFFPEHVRSWDADAWHDWLESRQIFSSWLGIICNFNIIFNPVVALMSWKYICKPYTNSTLCNWIQQIPVDVTDIPNLFYLSAYPSDGARGA